MQYNNIPWRSQMYGFNQTSAKQTTSTEVVFGQVVDSQTILITDFLIYFVPALVGAITIFWGMKLLAKMTAKQQK